MTFHVRELSTSDPAALKTFIALERRLIGASPLFVSEIDTDVLKCLSGRSKYYSDMEHTLFVAEVGSIRNLSTTMGHSTGLIKEQFPVWRGVWCGTCQRQWDTLRD